MAGSRDDSGAAWLLLFVLVGVFGSGWLFDVYGWVSERRAAAEAEAVEVVEDVVRDAVEGRLPDVTIPDVGIELPDIELPDIDLPSIGGVDGSDGSDGDPVVTVAPPAEGFAPAPTWNDPFPTPGVNDYAQAWERLENAPIAASGTASVYDRETWMPSWSPIEGVADGSPSLPSGCTVREWLFVIWAEPGTNERRDDCYTLAGEYVDGYIDGEFTIPVDRAVRSVDGEHLIALVEAHISGGDKWDEVQRNTFATDYTIRSYADGGTQLLLADGPENQHAKNKYDTAGYLPATESSRCGFVVSVIAVKDRYGLAFDAEEVSALIDQLTICQEGGVPPRP